MAMSNDDTERAIAAHTDHYVQSMGAIPPSLRLLAEEAPAFFDGYSRMRSWALRDDAEGVLPLKYRHLLCSLLDCAGGNLNGATNHARAAVRRGLTVDEYRDAAVLLIITDGTPTWGEMGRKVLETLRGAENT
jgi:alkylhydroperoxidase/carboxymuconolactone decarboxylase family protein YurZ